LQFSEHDKDSWMSFTTWLEFWLIEQIFRSYNYYGFFQTLQKPENFCFPKYIQLIKKCVGISIYLRIQAFCNNFEKKNTDVAAITKQGKD